MAARARRGTMPDSCVNSAVYRWKDWKFGQNGATILKPLMPNPLPTQLLFHLMQHVADWVAPFHGSQKCPLPPLKYLHTPLPLP